MEPSASMRTTPCSRTSQRPWTGLLASIFQEIGSTTHRFASPWCQASTVETAAPYPSVRVCLAGEAGVENGVTGKSAIGTSLRSPSMQSRRVSLSRSELARRDEQSALAEPGAAPFDFYWEVRLANQQCRSDNFYICAVNRQAVIQHAITSKRF